MAARSQSVATNDAVVPAVRGAARINLVSVAEAEGRAPARSLEQVVDRWGRELERRIREGLLSTGLVREMLRYHLASGGKRLRAVVPVWLCESLGGDAEDAIDLGVGLELIHNATLIHDDLQDGDEHRRGAPTVWRRWGEAQAINAGDALIFEGIARMERAPAGPAAVSAASAALLRVIRGQAMEFQLKLSPGDADRIEPSMAAWRVMAGGKTGALFSACMQAGALAACADPDTIEACAEYGELLGLLFQVQDDYLDLVGEKGRTFRGSDVMEGKLSFPVVWAYENAAADEVAALRAVVERPRDETTHEMIEEALALLDRTGALAATAEWLQQAGDEAHAHPLAELVPGLADRILAPVAAALPPPRSGVRLCVPGDPESEG